MFLMTGDAKYMDVFERSLYNGVLSGVSLSGDRFFYPNPLEYDGRAKNNHGFAGRAPWFGCACCPPNVLRTIAMSGRTLSDLVSDLVTYPQVLVNVRVRERVDLRTVPQVAKAMALVEERLAGKGRLLVRYSGTEPLLRIMLEGPDERDINTWAQEIARAAVTALA